MRRLLAHIGIVAALATALVVAVPSAASATPSRCQAWYYNPSDMNYGWGGAWCGAGTGQYRVVITCKVSSSSAIAVVGNWTPVENWLVDSRANCPLGSTAIGVGVRSSTGESLPYTRV